MNPFPEVMSSRLSSFSLPVWSRATFQACGSPVHLVQNGDVCGQKRGVSSSEFHLIVHTEFIPLAVFEDSILSWSIDFLLQVDGVRKKLTMDSIRWLLCATTGPFGHLSGPSSGYSHSLHELRQPHLLHLLHICFTKSTSTQPGIHYLSLSPPKLSTSLATEA